MARLRDYKAEYARRIARGKARGLSRSQARGHARPNEKAIRPKTIQSDASLEFALRLMRGSKTQSSAAKEAGVSVERLRRFLYQNELARHQGKGWLFSDNRVREMTVLSEGRTRQLRLRGFDEASANGSYLSAVKRFINSNDPSHLADFEGRAVRDAKGKQHPFETDPNALYRLVAADDEPFEVTYKLVTI